MFKAIIFDMDGLMIDSERYYRQTMQEMAKKRGKVLEEKTRWKGMGRSAIESMRVFRHDLELSESAEDLLKERTDMMREHYREEICLLSGVKELISHNADLKMAIASGSQREFVDIIMKRFGLKMDSSVSGEEVAHGKPAPDIYIKAADSIGIVPCECIVLEDAENGIVAAKAAGCYAIAVPSEYTKGQDFSSADYVAKDLFDADNHIRNLISHMR